MTNTRDGLYHAEVGLPERYRHPNSMVPVAYSNHARRAAGDDRYGSIPLPGVLHLTRFETVEVEISGGRVSKIVVRGPLDDTRDAVYVLIPNFGKRWFCKTVWVNLNSDQHKTLDKSRYVH